MQDVGELSYFLLFFLLLFPLYELLCDSLVVVVVVVLALCMCVCLSSVTRSKREKKKKKLFVDLRL